MHVSALVKILERSQSSAGGMPSSPVPLLAPKNALYAGGYGVHYRKAGQGNEALSVES